VRALVNIRLPFSFPHVILVSPRKTYLVLVCLNTDVVSKLACKLRAMVRHNFLQDAEEGEDLLLVDVHEFRGRQSDGSGDCDHHFGEVIHNVGDRIVVFGGRERANEVD